jgi:hypothetical protein
VITFRTARIVHGTAKDVENTSVDVTPAKSTKVTVQDLRISITKIGDAPQPEISQVAGDVRSDTRHRLERTVGNPISRCALILTHWKPP